MESRYEFADRKTKMHIKKVIKEQFPLLDELLFLVFFDHKKRMSGNKFVLARVKKAGDEIRALTEEEFEPNGVHVVFFFDYSLFRLIDTKDKKRIIYHELCHVVPSEKDDASFNVVPHDFEGFYSEIDYNNDDPDWSKRLAGVLEEYHKNSEK